MVSPWFVFNLIKICNHVFRAVLPLLYYYPVLTTGKQFLHSETGFQSVATILRTGIFEFLYCGNNTNPSLKLWDILWLFRDHTDRSTSYVYQTTDLKITVPTGYMNLAAPLNTFVSTLIFKRILLKRLIIQGQRKKSLKAWQEKRSVSRAFIFHCQLWFREAAETIQLGLVLITI